MPTSHSLSIMPHYAPGQLLTARDPASLVAVSTGPPMHLFFLHICGYRSGLFVVWSYIRLQRERVVQRYINAYPHSHKLHHHCILFLASLHRFVYRSPRLPLHCVYYCRIFRTNRKTHTHRHVTHHTQNIGSLCSLTHLFFSFTVLLLSSFFLIVAIHPISLLLHTQCISFVLRDV